MSLQVLSKVGVPGLLAGLCMAPAVAATVTYAGDRAGFVAATGATSIGALPGSGGNNTVVGNVTFTNGTPLGSLQFGNFSNEISGNDLAMSGEENFNMAIAGGAYAIGFDLHEPSYVGNSSPVNGCNATCYDTTFEIELFSGAISLGIFTYNAPDDGSPNAGQPIGFFGVHSSLLFDRVAVRDATATIDNEFFGNFLSGGTALVPGPSVPEPSTLALTLAAGGAFGAAVRRRRI